MSDAARKVIAGILIVLAAGAGIGWLYDRPAVGLLIASLVCLAWQLRQLLMFDRALRTGDFDEFRHGEGIWAQIFSRFRFEHERALRRKNSYRGLLREIRKSTNAMPDGAIILDADNEMVTCNRAAKELAGLRRKKDRGQRIDNILRDPELARLLQENDYQATINMASPVDVNSWLNCRVVPYGADQKLLLLRDVTDRVRMSKMRRDFVANASHELRSPLTVISGYLDSLAEDEELPEAWVKPVAQMQGQANRMRLILGDLLKLSRLEVAGPASLDDTVDVGRLLDKSKAAFEGHADVARIQLAVASTDLLSGNASEIETVIVNLVSNAIRHTPRDGEITLSWSSGRKGGDLVVSDTGEGIDAQYIPRLTERFFRVDRGRSRDDGGTGLGLAIVKHVLVRHGAELIISSEPGKGSTFRCHFPADRLVAAAPADESPSPAVAP
jgi:two-component system phosphate regulon sensor histidine kinase PhoR